jgi:hypothetical protein
MVLIHEIGVRFPVGSQSASANTKVLALLRFVGPTGNRKELLAKPDEKLFVRTEATGSRNTIL